MCYADLPNDTPDVRHIWSGSRDLTAYDSFYSGDTFEIKNGPTYIIHSGAPYHVLYGPIGYGWDATIKLDTIVRLISISYDEHTPDPYFIPHGAGSFSFDSMSFVMDKFNIQGLTTKISAEWEGKAGHTCFLVNGWVTIGDASPPASVSTKQIPSNTFKAIAMPDNSIRFSFETRTEASPLLIFDLLGRERDVISIAPGSESYEYNSAHLTQGMYVATLGGSAVKIVVR
ncbi:MAG: hypothetical protein Q8921_08125 [Bacteroidota bacterium]|nr:hypothetical protein [Bacteroidota bacterium]